MFSGTRRVIGFVFVVLSEVVAAALVVASSFVLVRSMEMSDELIGVGTVIMLAMY